jgi:uncharacterized membrane protein YccC
VALATTSAAPVNDTAHAARTAAAATLCLLLVTALGLEHGNLAVWTSFMVMAQYPFTIFQKGIERIIGRGLGILLGLVFLTLLRNAWGLSYLFEALALAVFFYVHFCGRLAYTFLNAGLYLAVMINLGHSDYAVAVPEGGRMFLAIVIGVVIADLITWLSGTESDLRIQTAHAPLWPIDPGRLGHTLLLAITVLLTETVTTVLQLPQNTALVSVMVLMIAPDLQSMIRKGKLRIAGVLLAMLYGLLSLLLLMRMPHLLLFLGLLFLGIFLAAYLTRRGGENAYAGLQMGLVLPMVLVVPPEAIGSVSAAVSRGFGVLIALGCSMLVGGLGLALVSTSVWQPTVTQPAVGPPKS